MKIENTYEVLRGILAKQLRKDPSVITPDAQIKKDLGADSLDILQLLMKLEDDYGVVIPDEKLAGFNTVGDIVGFLESL